MVEGELVQFGVLLFQLLVMPLLPRHFPVPQDGVVQMVLHAGVIQAVQIGQVQGGLAFVSQNIHVIFQGDLVAGEGAGLVHTQNVHAAESLHGVDVFDHRLLLAHGRAALCQTSVDHHGEHFGGQAHGHRKGEQEGLQPVPLGQPAGNEYHRHQHRHEADQHPGDGVGPPVKAVFELGFRRGKSAVYRVFSHGQHNALPAAAGDRGAHEGEVAVIGIGAGRSLGQRVGGFLQYGAFAGENRLGNKQILGFGEPDIGGNAVAGGKTYPVAHHQIVGGNPQPAALSARLYRGRNHLGEVVGNALGAQLLDKPDDAADQQHTDDDHRSGDVPAEIGGHHHIGEKGNGGQHKQDDGEGIDKGSAQAIQSGVRRPARQGIFAVFRAAFLHLGIAVPLGRNMKIPA